MLSTPCEENTAVKQKYMDQYQFKISITKQINPKKNHQKLLWIMPFDMRFL